jgi:serine/threonine protein kinase
MENLTRLGEGTFGTVYKIMSLDNEKAYAGKHLKKAIKMMDEKEMLSYERELDFLQKTSHPFVVKFIEEFLFQEKKIFIFELATEGDLVQHMQKK